MSERWALAGVGVTVALVAVALLVPPLSGWDVHSFGVAPLNARWRPRVGPGTVPALILGIASVHWAPRLSAVLRWPALLAAAFSLGVGWLASLATVDGWPGIGRVLGNPDEYLPTARQVTNVGATLRAFTDRIPASAGSSWPTHVAGHPPGALLFFVGLVKVGLGSDLAAGWVVLLLAATAPLAVLMTLRALGAEATARRAAPVLVVGPAAIWLAVSADAVFTAVGAWALCCLALATSARGAWRTASWSLLSGLLFGIVVFMSYGLPLLVVIGAAVLVLARNPRPVFGVLAGTVAVVLAFAAAGFLWWQALPVLRARYYAGTAAVRPAAYWVWGDLAALCFSAGPLLGACLAVALQRSRHVRAADVDVRSAVLLTLAAACCIALADLSFMSKAETERIWLPFVPWLLIGAALLPETLRRRALAGQVAVALVVQTLLFTHW